MRFTSRRCHGVCFSDILESPIFETSTLENPVAEHPEILDAALAHLYLDLGVSENDEQEAHNPEKGILPEAVALGMQRSFSNIRESLKQYVAWRVKNGVQPDQVISEVESRSAETRDNLVMSYYETLSDAERIISSNSLKNLFEFAGTEQDERKNAGEFGIEDALHKRRIIDEALGWKHPETVYHLAVEAKNEGHDPNGPNSNYGSVRFVFDYDALGNNATFSEGDSLNPNHLPQALANKTDFASPTRGVEQRQIAREQVPIAKAILSLSTELENEDFNSALFLRYIEAQVGDIAGAEIFKALKGIEINLSQAFREARNSRLLFNQAKEDEIYERYFKRKVNDPGSYLDFDSPAEPVDIEGYDTELTKLRMATFTHILDEMKIFCENNGMEYRQQGDMREVEEMCRQR